MQNYVGQQIDRYRITERLGMGGMAVVYKAYDTRLERDVALKLIRTESIPQDQHERLFKRFEREAKAQARFKHPHIVAVHDYGEVDNSPYLVMDFISGGTLKERLHSPVDWRQAIRWLIPVAEALAYAHKEGIIHRDVKPANILFDKGDQPILTDFGIAKVLETDETTLTGTGLGVGTPEYMAPEQWQGKTSSATDQYALGIVLYELITGRKPYSADTPAAIILMQANEPLQAPSNIVNCIPEAVEKVLYKALARDPQDRYQDMDEFSLALRGLLAEAYTGEPIPPVRESIRKDPIYASGTSAESEGITRDVLDTTSVGKMDAAHKSRHGLPKWVLWTGVGIIGLVIIGLAIDIISGNFMNMGKSGEGPLAIEKATPTQTSTPEITEVLIDTPTVSIIENQTYFRKIDGMVMVLIPEGEFVMGLSETKIDFLINNICPYCEKTWFSDSPSHVIYLNNFWIDQTEITNAMYQKYIDETGYVTQAELVGKGETFDGEGRIGSNWKYPLGPDRPIENWENYPVVQLTWQEALDYCMWAGGNLPTEAQWEKAARGTDERLWPWGNSIVDGTKANYLDSNWDFGDQSSNDLFKFLAPVGSYPAGASPYGVLDLFGNAAEWILDWYDPDYYLVSDRVNPTGPEEPVILEFSNDSRRVIRGGDYGEFWHRPITVRYSTYWPETMADSQGFRCIFSEEDMADITN
ncbi:MAG: SUMF1/EgtB/PvdO family nonheme iron enzyme [Anaerolineaceae bacterium]|nr:SUMF1/EgtB/PvdO family nonheme iron enzyme [Anaerolineaceae bacterium]